MDMVQKGEVSATDPISKYLPANVKMPERSAKSITLQDLATYSQAAGRVARQDQPMGWLHSWTAVRVPEPLPAYARYRL